MITDIISIGAKLIDKVIPDPQAAAQAKRDLIEMQMNGDLKELETRMSAILAEAQSSDPWTSRARPSFMYVFYGVILMMTMVAPLLGIFFPDSIAAFYNGVGRGFASIPEAMWTTFTVGYLGYAGARSYDKRKLAEKNLPWKR